MTVINFYIFDINSHTRKPEKVTGTFSIGPKEYALTMPMVAQIGNEDLTSAYRRELTQVRDALSDMIESADGIESLAVCAHARPCHSRLRRGRTIADLGAATTPPALI